MRAIIPLLLLCGCSHFQNPGSMTRNQLVLAEIRYCSTLAGREDSACPGRDGRAMDGMDRWVP